jgi:hypothetical protein
MPDKFDQQCYHFFRTAAMIVSAVPLGMGFLTDAEAASDTPPTASYTKSGRPRIRRSAPASRFGNPSPLHVEPQQANAGSPLVPKYRRYHHSARIRPDKVFGMDTWDLARCRRFSAVSLRPLQSLPGIRGWGS